MIGGGGLTVALLLGRVALLTRVLLLGRVGLLLGGALLISFLLLAVLGVTFGGTADNIKNNVGRCDTARKKDPGPPHQSQSTGIRTRGRCGHFNHLRRKSAQKKKGKKKKTNLSP